MDAGTSSPHTATNSSPPLPKKVPRRMTTTADQPMTNVGVGSDVRRYATPRNMYEHIDAATRNLAPQECVRNFCGVIESMREQDLVIETELFPRDALEFYTAFNLEGAVKPAPEVEVRMDELKTAYLDPFRGSGQGDYRHGMIAKVENVVDCLSRFPGSKRAVLAVPFGEPGRGSAEVSHEEDESAKCVRELHLYIDGADQKLHATGFMRAQAASIFPKNVHFIGKLMNFIAARLGREVGTYTHFVTTLVHGR